MSYLRKVADPEQQARYPEVERRPQLSVDEFHRDYVGKRPVVMTGLTAGWKALGSWSLEFFEKAAPDLSVRVKSAYVSDGQASTVTLAQYCDLLKTFSEARRTGKAAQPPPYLHDFPMFSVLPRLRADLEPFPVEFFPRLYQREWWLFTQFFFGAPESLTPLHFDCLETGNLFFQVVGRKRFILIRPEDRRYLAIRDWRWAQVDAERPDLTRFPEFQKASPSECTVGPGDVLYLPPGTAHQVRGLDVTVSFNIDWHSRMSALRGVLAVRRGMPLKNAYYNAVIAMALCTGLPSRWVMPLYKSYLNYIS